jgi:hypothetical protein
MGAVGQLLALAQTHESPLNAGLTKPIQHEAVGGVAREQSIVSKIR